MTTAYPAMRPQYEHDMDAVRRARAALADTPVDDGNLHPDTVAMVRDFAAALALKLRKSEQKYGYANGWLADDWEDECRQQLANHLAKGDPLDVAAYAAFMWRRGWRTALADAPNCTFLTGWFRDEFNQRAGWNAAIEAAADHARQIADDWTAAFCDEKAAAGDYISTSIRALARSAEPEREGE